MKKRIMIALVAFMFVVIGGFAFSKIAGATDTGEPIMTLTANTNQVTAFENSNFTIEYIIGGGEILFASNGNLSTKTIKNNYITFEKNNNFELISASSNGKKLSIENNKINLGTRKYKYIDGSFPPILKSQDIKVVLEIKALREGIFEKENSLEKFIKLEHDTLKDGSQIRIPKEEVNVNVGKLQFTTEPKFETAGLIYGNSTVQYPAKENPLEVGLNRYFEVDYNINAGVLGVVSSLDTDGEMKVLSDVDINSDRNIIYVVDKAAIDLNGGNEEVARESIKKGLEDIKTSNPDIKTSLIVYGDKAEIISIDDKTTLTIDQLISKIDGIESTDKSGNLGDAIRKAKYLASKNENSSIVIVSAGNPNYYTKLSEGNDALLESRSNKDGFVAEDIKIAEQYVNNIVNDIAVNEVDETRWYGVNYGIEEQQLLLNDCIDKLGGLAPEVKNPYYDDFATINKSAITPIKIKASLEVKSKDDRIEIHPEDIKKEFEFSYSQNGDLIQALKATENLKIRAKISRLNDTSDVINIISSDANEGVEATLSVEINGEVKKYKFNEDKAQGLYTKVTIPYITRVGLYNGRMNGKIGETSKAITIDDIKQFNKIASELIEDVPSPELAIENYYSFAALIKSDATNKVKLFYDAPLVNSEEIKGEIYEVIVSGDSFTIDKNNVTKLNNTATQHELKAGKTYLIVIDDYIETEKLDINGVGKPFNIGVTVFDSQTNNTESGAGEDWTIRINSVPKPEHF